MIERERIKEFQHAIKTLQQFGGLKAVSYLEEEEDSFLFIWLLEDVKVKVELCDRGWFIPMEHTSTPSSTLLDSTSTNQASSSNSTNSEILYFESLDALLMRISPLFKREFHRELCRKLEGIDGDGDGATEEEEDEEEGDDHLEHELEEENDG